MGAELNVLDWLFACGQGFFAASFFYFLYLFMRFSAITPIICSSLQGWSGVLINGQVVASSRYFSME